MELSKYVSPIRNFYLVFLVGVLGFLTFLIFAPFLNILVISYILVELFYPVYRNLKRPSLANVLASVLFAVLFWVILPICIIYTAVNAIELTTQNKKVNLSKIFWNNLKSAWQMLWQFFNSNGFAAVIATVVTVLFVVLPIVFVILIALGDAIAFTNRAQQSLIGNEAIVELPRQFIAEVNRLLDQAEIPQQFRLQTVNLTALLQDLGGTIAGIIGVLARDLLTGGFNLLFQFFLLIISMIFIYQLRDRMREIFSQFSPLHNELDQLFFDRFTVTTRAVVKGTALVAIAQATAVAVVMWLMGFESIILFWMIMVLASIIPIGSGVVWFPAGISLILSGNPISGIFLIIYGAVIINVIDSVLRPLILKESINLHPLLTLFSILGGISIFGVIGIIYGPLITVFFISIMHVYNVSKHENTVVTS